MSIFEDKEIKEYITYSDECLKNMGFTEHGFAHIIKVTNTVEYILSELGYDEHTIALGKVAAYLHDIGNCVNRNYHSHSGALMAQRILENKGYSISDIAKISYAIGNHDESTGVPSECLSAALILADKSDVRRSRVRKDSHAEFDIHDKVNYSVIESNFEIDKINKVFKLNISLNKEYSTSLDYYEIFLDRMLLCKKAAKVFNYNFDLQLIEIEK